MAQPPNTITNGGRELARLSAQMESLAERVDRGFEGLQRSLDERNADAKKLDERLRALEQKEARAEGSSYDGRLTDHAKRIREVEKWRWYLAGAGAIALALLGLLK